MNKISRNLAGFVFSATLLMPFVESLAASSERVIEHAGDWSDVLVNEKALCITSEQNDLKIQIYPSPDRKSLYLKIFPKQSFGLDGVFQAGDFSIPLNYLQSPTPAPVFGAIITADKMMAFVHGFTSSRTALVKISDSENTISLAGTSPAIDGLIFYAHEHILNLPKPFGDEGSEENNTDSSTVPTEIFPDSEIPKDETRSNATSAKCADDFHSCKDNQDLVNNYNNIYKAKADCKIKAEDSAQYGTPQWPGFWSGGPFGSFQMGQDAPKTGLITLVESNAQFQNGYGAMVHSTVICTYDLNKSIVRNIEITAH
ncbi:hypothetical protein [Novacetimonas hansenii]|uniref:hypothetical protein n=1 Tax=Novacetimonas hansenii TaxID=436 RepID=UPI000B24E0FF|nr:hypothetical protein [Novacetimonas hansenii]